MEGYSKPVDFYLPGIFQNNFFEFYERFLYVYKNHRNFFYDNANISAFYDAPQGVIWNGGRVGRSGECSSANKVKTLLEEYNIPMRFTFTNSQLKEKHLENDFCNILLKMFATGKNEIIVASDLLYDYIKNKYGDKYKYISSTTKCILNKDKLEEEMNKYFLTVLDFRLNKNFNLLKNLKNKDKLEILLNEACNYNCKNRKACYEGMSKMNLLGEGVLSKDDLEEKIVTCDCNPKYSLTFTREMTQPMFISNEDIENIYIPMGYSHFKINGRSFPLVTLAESLVHYLIKDKYKIMVRESLILGNLDDLNKLEVNKFSCV